MGVYIEGNLLYLQEEEGKGRWGEEEKGKEEEGRWSNLFSTIILELIIICEKIEEERKGNEEEVEGRRRGVGREEML